MAVNPKLETLMRVIEDNQDKMTEGEYLEAMNALAALHREVPALLFFLLLVLLHPTQHQFLCLRLECQKS